MLKRDSVPSWNSARSRLRARAPPGVLPGQPSPAAAQPAHARRSSHPTGAAQPARSPRAARPRLARARAAPARRQPGWHDAEPGGGPLAGLRAARGVGGSTRCIFQKILLTSGRQGGGGVCWLNAPWKGLSTGAWDRGIRQGLRYPNGLDQWFSHLEVVDSVRSGRVCRQGHRRGCAMPLSTGAVVCPLCTYKIFLRSRSI